MTDLIRCAVCKGRKKVNTFGGMMLKCSDCSGIGWIEEPKDLTALKAKAEALEAKLVNDNDDAPEAPKKRAGRPKKRA